MDFKRLLDQRDKVVFVAVDLQTRLLPVMFHQDMIIKNANILIEAANILDIPLIVTEQYPKGLGSTDERINTIADSVPVIEKTEFSIFQSQAFLEEIKKHDDRNIIVLFGIETHICIYQSALDAFFNKDKKYSVYLIEDACSSRKKENHENAIRRMEKMKINIENTEMLLFQFLGKAGGDEFKKISALIK